MKNTLKKTLSLLLALTMVLSLGLPAYAIGVPEDGGLIDDERGDRFGGVGRISDLVDDDELVIVDEPVEPIGEPIDEDLEIEVSPEQSFNFAEEATGFSVEVSAPAGALPLGTEMVVDRLVDLAAVQAAVDAAENLRGEVQLAADISFWHEGKEIEPAEGTKLLVRMSAPEIEGIADPIIVHIPDGENAVPEIVEQVKSDDDVVMVNTIEFEADSFSTFAVVWSGNGGTSNTTGYVAWYNTNEYEIWAYVTVHYVDQNGNPIPRPSNIYDTYNNSIYYYDFSGTGTYTVQISTLAQSISGYTYKNAYRVYNNNQVNLTRMDYVLNNNSDSVKFYNGSNNFESVSLGNNTNAGDIYLVYEGETSGNQVTVHYGYIENDEFKEFTDEQIRSTSFPKNGINTADYSNSNPYAFLEYDFKGYTYKETRRSSATGSTISPVLRMNQTTPQYTTSTSPGSWSNLSTGEAIYVIYEKTDFKMAIGDNAGGDAPVVTPPEKLPSSKHVVRNDDGTYDITLSVTGKVGESTSVAKASVIVIFDISNSMAYDLNRDGGSSNERLTTAKNAVYSLANTLLNLTDEKTGEHLVEMALISFNTNVSVANFGTTNNPVYFTTNYGYNTETGSETDTNGFHAKVRALTYPGNANGATNWEAALRAADALQCSTTAPTYVIFVTDGDPTVRVGRANDTDSEIYTHVQRNGNSNFDWGTCLNSTSYFGLGYNTTTGHYDAAVYAGVDLREHNKKFFGIGLGVSAGKVQNLVNDVYDGVTLPDDEIAHYYPATSQSQIEEAFAKIAKAVSDDVGYTEVTLDDGVTEFSTIELTLVEGAHSYTCYKDGVEWPEGPAPEVVNSRVKWSPAGTGALEDGVTYSIKFTIWPSQEAYDLIANINNKIVYYPDGTVGTFDTADDAYNAYTTIYSDLHKQIEKGADGKYTLKTNTDYKLTYKYNGQSIEQKPTEPMENKAMPLPTETISIKKIWNNYLDTRSASNVILTLTRSNENYLNIEMGEPTETIAGKQWEQSPDNELFISMGQMTVSGEDIEIKSEGHDYTVEEPESFSYRWELTSDVYHPMVINGTATVLVEVQDISKAPSDVQTLAQNKTKTASDGSVYYAFNGKLYVQSTDTEMLATNDRRSSLNVKKVVTGNGAPETDTFPIQLHLNNPDGKHPDDSTYDFWNDAIWFSVQTDPTDRNTVVLDGVVVEGATAEISELRIHDPNVSDIQLHEADDNYPYDYITYNYKGEPNTVKAVDLELHTGTETVEGTTIEYSYYAYYTGFYWFDNNGTAVVNLKANQYICITNLANGTVYDITELTDTLADYGYEYTSVVSDVTSTTDDLGTKATDDNDEHKASGTIDKANNTYSSVFTNNYKGCFYVYHSADNTVEKIFLTDSRVVEGKFNIAKETKDGFIYGGYYQDGGYADATVVTSGDNAVSFEKKGEDYKTKLAYVTEERTGGIWGTVDGGKAYMGDGTKWTADKAYTDNGMAMTPAENTVYYLKEVPEAYLRGMIRYTYYEDPGNKYPIGTLWLVCAVDGEYSEFGVARLNEETGKYLAGTISNSITITPIGDTSKSHEYVAEEFLRKYNSDHENVPGFKPFTDGKVGFIKVYDKRSIDPYTEDCLKIKEGEPLCLYWITPDGVTVTGTRQFSVTNIVKGTGVKIDGEPYITLTKANVVSTLTEPAATGSGT